MTFVTKRFIADCHFGHAKIIASCRRPFSSTAEMDEHMIYAWNKVVRPDDLTYVLGDFSMGLQDEDRVRSIFARLMGRKRLILGNHDLTNHGDLHPTLAGLDWDAAPVHAAETTDSKYRVYMSHYAHRVWPASGYGSVHFFGHSHSQLPGTDRSRDVGVDMPDVDFTPRTFAELTGRMKLER
jgi:calcineurin-like phosphoesterase family protein